MRAFLMTCRTRSGRARALSSRLAARELAHGPLGAGGQQRPRGRDQHLGRPDRRSGNLDDAKAAIADGLDDLLHAVAFRDRSDGADT